MAMESTQHKLDRVRAPRVQITYDVEVGDAIEMKELPFVMGVLGDLTGQPEKPLAALKERKFVEINPDNFDAVLKGMEPQDFARNLHHPDQGIVSLDRMLAMYAWHSAHHTAHITSLREREGW